MFEEQNGEEKGRLKRLIQNGIKKKKGRGRE